MKYIRGGIWLLMLVICTWPTGAWSQHFLVPPIARVEQPVSATGLSGLPVAAQPNISAALGHHDSRYRVRAMGSGFRADNPQQGLAADFTRKGIELRSAGARWGLTLRGYGYGSALRTVHRTDPRISDANLLEYRHGPLTEWYVNGPLGLEQGFTLKVPPGRKNGQPLTIALALSGDLNPSVMPGGNGLILSRRGGKVVLRYAGLFAHDAVGRQLTAWLEVQGQRFLLEVEDAGARYPLVIDPFFQQAELTASGAAAAVFGHSVASSRDGSTLVVGAPVTSIGSNTQQGAAFVFLRPGSGWTTTATFAAELTASDGSAFDEFGESVAISGDGSTIIVGAEGAATPPGSSPGTGQGAAYVFVKPPSGWATTSNFAARLTATDTALEDQFGHSVASSNDGSTLLVGAPEPTSSFGSTGAAYVFVEPAVGWTTMTQTAELTPSDGKLGDNFGGSVAISRDANTVVAGANAKGEAYLFVKPGGRWTNGTETAKLSASDGASSFGASVTVSGDGSTVAVGNPGLNNNQGEAYVFVEPASGWTTTTETARLTASDGTACDEFGISVAISGDGSTVLVGAPFHPSSNNVFCSPSTNAGPGATYEFVKPASGWANGTQTTTLTASNGLLGAEFGFRVASSGDGNTLLIGAQEVNAAYVFLQAPLATLSLASLNFGVNQPVPVGTSSAPQTVTLTNNGVLALTVTGVSVTSGFATTTNCITASPLQPSASCSEAVTFAPTMTGPVTGTLTFTDNSGNIAGTTQTVSLGGTAVKADTTTTITSDAPNPSVVGQPVTVGFSVAPPANDIFSPSGNVSVTASTGETCMGSAPSGSCALTFTTVGSRSLTASYGGDNNFNGSTSASVTQAVGDFSISAAPASETIGLGKVAVFAITLTPLGGFTGTVTLTCSGGPVGTICSISPASVALNGSSSSSATVTISVPKADTSKGTFTFTLMGISPGLTHSTTVSLTVRS